MKRLASFVLLVSLAVPAAAEEEPKPAPAEAETAPEPVMLSGATRYKLTLEGGRKVTGVVRDKSLYQRREGVGYVGTHAEHEFAGVRLWYWQGQAGFIFVPAHVIVKAEDLGRVTDDDQKRIDEMKRKAGERAEAERETIRAEKAKRAAEAAEREADAESKPEAGGAGDGEDADADPVAAKLTELLTEFPPSDWSLDRPEKIRHRQVILGLAPSDKERAFVKAFPEWKKAYAWWQSQGGKGGGGDANESEADSVDKGSESDETDKPGAEDETSKAE